MRGFRTLCACLGLLLGGTALAGYRWENVVQTVDIQADGEVLVTDERTLIATGDDDFTEAFICVRLTPGQSLTLLEGSSLTIEGSQGFQQPCSGGQEVVVEHPRRLERSRVRFVYRLDGSVDVFSDVVQWYWQIIEDEHPTIRGYDLTVNTPGPMASNSDYDAYVHRFSNLEEPRVSLSSDRSELRVQFNRIPDGEGVEIRYLMAPELFTLESREPGFEKLLRDELEVAGLQEGQRERLRFRSNPAWGLIGFVIFSLLALGMWQAYLRFGQEPRLEVMKYPFEPPSDLPPAAVTFLQNQHYATGLRGPAFHATILDLARRGFAEFTGEGKNFGMRLNLTKSAAELEPFELDVLGYLQRAARTDKRGNDAVLDLKELKAYSKKNGSKFMERWGAKPRQFAQAHFGGELLEAKSLGAMRRWIGFSLLAAVPCILAALLAAGAARAILIAFAFACGFMVVPAVWALPAWKPHVAKEVRGWQGFRRTLKDYTRMKDAPADFYKLWDKYFVYAAALGVATAFLKNLRRVAPIAGIAEDELMRRGSWMGAGSASDFASFSNSISSMSSALNSAGASASSGGSSSGGGGGGGGGSSGGR